MPLNEMKPSFWLCHVLSLITVEKKSPASLLAELRGPLPPFFKFGIVFDLKTQTVEAFTSVLLLLCFNFFYGLPFLTSPL